jgi:heterodisulfide reductase subunit B
MPPGGDSQFAHRQCPLGHEKKSLASIVVACPLCHVNLDARQRQIGEEFKETFQPPIIYFTQLMGLAFGSKKEELGLDKHFVDPTPLLKRIEDNSPLDSHTLPHHPIHLPQNRF